MFETLILLLVLWVVLAAVVKLWTWFFAPLDQLGKQAPKEPFPPLDKTAEELYEEIMQMAAKDLDCSVEELRELLKDELQEQRRQQGKPDLHIVK